MKTALEWKTYYSSPEFRDNYIYRGNDLGVSCTDGGTSFKLWSPSADSVTLNLYKDGSKGKPFFCVPMMREEQGVSDDRRGERAQRRSVGESLRDQRAEEHGGRLKPDGSGRLGIRPRAGKDAGTGDL